MSREDEVRAVDTIIRLESNEAFRRGTLWAAFFGFASGALLLVLMRAGVLRNLELPAAGAMFAGCYCLLLHAAARRSLLTGGKAYAFMLPFVSFPTGFFLISGVMLPFGVATFLTGPYSYLYVCLVILTGFFFDRRLSRIAGILAAAQYSACVLLAAPDLARIRMEDPMMQQDFGSLPVYFIRASVILFAGFLVGSLASTARRLTLKVLAEENEKKGISRLFGQFVSPEVKDKIVREKSGTIGERKRVVVLLSDVRSFTTYSETADPAALVQHLNEYFDAMVGCITSRGGVIDKFMGDAVMAVFGGVLELPNPAEAALDAACAMRERLKDVNRVWKQRGMHELDNGIGLHFGEVLQGTLGSHDRKEFTVIGDTVNVAARLESITRDEDFPILTSRALVDALPEARRQACVALGARKLKGKTHDVEVFGVRA